MAQPRYRVRYRTCRCQLDYFRLLGALCRQIDSSPGTHFPSETPQGPHGNWDVEVKDWQYFPPLSHSLIRLASTAFFLGFPFVTIVVNIPQRAQAVDALSPVHAGLALLPLLLCSAFSSAFPGMLTSKMNIHHAYLLMVGATLQLIGVGLSSALPTTTDKIAAQQYGYEAIMGTGFGLQMSTLMILAPLVVKEADLGLFKPNASHEAWILTRFASCHDGLHYADSRSRRDYWTRD